MFVAVAVAVAGGLSLIGIYLYILGIIIWMLN